MSYNYELYVVAKTSKVGNAFLLKQSGHASELQLPMTDHTMAQL